MPGFTSCRKRWNSCCSLNAICSIFARRVFPLAQRILYVITRAEPGGAQSHVLELIRAYSRQFVVQLATEESGLLVDQAKSLGVSVVPVKHLVMEMNPAKDLLAVRELSHVIRQFKPDLVHAHSSKAGLIARIAARLNRVPCIFTAHGWAFSEGVPTTRKWIVLMTEWFAGRLGTATIAVSEFDRRLGLRYKVSPPSRIVAIENGIPDHPLRADPADGDPPIVIMVARFSVQKDQRTLLEACSQIRLPFRLWLVGDGPLLDSARALAQELKVSDRVKFWGNSKSVPQLLQQCHIFALITHYEGLPISILEAMRAGLPVVATDTGGVSETVCHGYNGLLVPRRDPAAVRQAIEQLLGNQVQRTTFGANSRAEFEARFTAQEMLEKTLTEYKQIWAEGKEEVRRT